MTSRQRPCIPTGRGSRLKSGSVWVRPPAGARSSAGSGGRRRGASACAARRASPRLRGQTDRTSQVAPAAANSSGRGAVGPLRDQVPAVARVRADVRREVVGGQEGRRRSGRSRPTAARAPAGGVWGARPATQIGMRGRWTGGGRIVASTSRWLAVVGHPSRREQPGQHVQRLVGDRRPHGGTTARRRSRRSRGRAGRRGRRRASTRPPLRWSRVARCLATTAGRRRDSGVTMVPIRIRDGRGRDRAEQHPRVVHVDQVVPPQVVPEEEPVPPVGLGRAGASRTTTAGSVNGGTLSAKRIRRR